MTMPGLIVLALLASCQGYDQPIATQTMVFRDLPNNADPYPPHYLIMRTNFEGSVEFIESPEFLIEVNIESPSIEDLAKVHYNYTDYSGAIMLQMYEAEPEIKPFILSQVPISYILLTLGGGTGIAFLVSIIFVCWWNVSKRPLVEAQARHKALSPDSSQAPLLEGRPIAEGQTPESNRQKKPRSKVNHTLAPGDEYVSSEDDMVDGRTQQGGGSPRKHYTTIPARNHHQTPPDSDLYATVRKDQTQKDPYQTYVGSDTMGSDSTATPVGSQMDVPSGKPVVSYIKIQGGQEGGDGTITKQKLGQTQYIPLNKDGSLDRYSDLDKQATLKIRRGDSYDDTMPDVVKSRTLPQHHPQAPQRGADSIPRRAPDTTRYVPLKPEKESDYSTVNKQLTGAQIAHLLSSDRRPGGSPKFTHNTDRPPTSFTGHRDDLDSVGSSRSGESSTAGTRTQVSSPFSHATDSDSAKSTASSAMLRGRDSAPPGDKFVLQQPPPGRYSHISPSGATDHSSDSGHGGSNPRLVDEAYGTMATNNSNTLRSSSTASTGSGSSGSVVTVVAADGDGHRKYYGSSPRGGPRGGATTGGGGMGRGPQKYLHASIICAVCLVTVATGVYGHMTAQTKVHFKVYAPPGFIKYKPQVFFKQGLNVNVTKQFQKQNLDVDRFEVKDARVYDLENDLSCNRGCLHGCDPNTGACICSVGYQLRAGHKCVDIDECRDNKDDCSSRTNCENFPGSYTCSCKSDYFGENNVCYSCKEPCRNGTFELMPCDKEHPKLCKECTKSCMENYYIHTACTPSKDIICQPCAEKCTYKMFEYTPCEGTQNRKCKAIKELQRPHMGGNLIYEDQRLVKNVLSEVIRQNYLDQPLARSTSIVRGSGFSVRINLKESNLAPLYQSVDHRESNDNEDLGEDGLEHVQGRYCNYPVPERYKLTHQLHRSITTKAKFHTCNKRRRQDAEKCELLTGYYLDPKERCLRGDDRPLGNLPELDRKGRSILCTTPGKLTSIFSVGTELNEMTMMFVDKTQECMDSRTHCDSCTQKCARTMQKHHGSHRCNITGEDADNGESPRLPNCYSCCAKDECYLTCEVYTQEQCDKRRCVVGNLAEFVLEAEFEPRRTIFGCHVEPVPGYKIYDIEYSVIDNGNIVNERRLRATKYYEKGHTHKSIDIHNFLKVYYGSDVMVQPDLIQGDTAQESFSAGFYQAKGIELKDADIKSSSIHVRPKRPFSVSTESWKQQDCNTASISDLIVTKIGSRENDLFRLEPNIRVVPVDPLQYRFYNRTGDNDEAHAPFIYYEVPQGTSILKAVYNETTVKDDSSLKAELTRNDNQWQLKVEGELSICPGYFGIRVMDPGYTRTPLYHYDIGVHCPAAFSVKFFIPTEGPDDYDKKLLVEISDTFRKIKLTVFRPAPNETAEAKDSPVQYAHKGEKEMTIFTPFIAVLCVIISFLILLLFVGFITERGKKPKKSENKVHSQHLLFVVCYVTFRAGYSIVVTFTVLLLLIKHVNRDSMTTLTEFGRYAETAENDQRLEIDHIQTYVMDELRRQNNIANDTKFICEKKLAELQNVLEDQKQQMRVENNEERLVSQVASQYTKLMILNLTHSISKFRDEFSAYSKVALDRLERNVVQTSSALYNNKWLEAAKLIHDGVQTKRSTLGVNTKGFEDWAGIKQEVQSLAVDLSLENFPMPNLTEFLNIDIPKTNNKQSSIPRISEINLPQNKWYYQFEKKPTIGAAGTLRPKRPKLKVSADDIISWSSLLAILVVIDLIWFVHRMAKTYSTAKMILYGCPSFVDCRKNNDPAARKPAAKRSISSRCFQGIKDFNLRVMKTEFVPKVVATATTCCAVYLILASSDQLLTVKTLASVGYFESMVAPVETSYRLAKTRVKTNAYRINKFEYPFYEELVNVRTKRYQLMLDMYAELQKSNNLLHDSEYCSWKKLLHPEEPCNCTFAQAEKLRFDGCELPPVTPHAYQKKDFGAYRDQLSRTIVPYVNSCRQVVMDTCHLTMIFVTILVLVDSLGAVTWIYLKRFNLLRLKPMFEIEQYPAPETMGNHT